MHQSQDNTDLKIHICDIDMKRLSQLTARAAGKCRRHRSRSRLWVSQGLGAQLRP